MTYQHGLARAVEPIRSPFERLQALVAGIKDGRNRSKIGKGKASKWNETLVLKNWIEKMGY